VLWRLEEGVGEGIVTIAAIYSAAIRVGLEKVLAYCRCREESSGVAGRSAECRGSSIWWMISPAQSGGKSASETRDLHRPVHRNTDRERVGNDSTDGGSNTEYMEVEQEDSAGCVCHDS